MKLRRKILALALGALGCATVLGNTAFAAAGTLTVRTFETEADGGKAIDGVDISIYRIASIDEDGKYTAAEDFAEALKDAGLADLSALDLTRSDNNRAARKALEEFLDSDRAVQPAVSATTSGGTAKFEIAEDALGLYLIRGSIIENYFGGSVDGQEGRLSYVPDSALVSVPSPPNRELKTDYWDYLPDVSIKYTKGAAWVEPQALKIIRETRLSVSGERDFTFIFQQVGGAPMPDASAYGWEELPADGDRGAFIKINAPFEKSRILSSSDSVKQEGSPQKIGRIWYTKPGHFEYLVYEMQESVAHYSFDKASYRLYIDVELAEDGTYKGTQWYEKVENGEVTETSDKVPTGSETDFTFAFKNEYTRTGGGGGGGGTPGGGTPGGSTPPAEPPVTPGALPKTGMLWWPVPVLAAAGFFLLAAGVILERNKDGYGSL